MYRGWISVSNVEKKNALGVTISCSLLPVLPKVVSRVRFLFDVNSDLLEIYEKLSTMNTLSPGLAVPGIRLPGCFDPFEMGVRAVLGQQITVKAASTLASRMADVLGSKIDTPFEFLNRTFPTAEEIYKLNPQIQPLGPSIENKLGPLGILSARSRSIFALAEALVNRQINLSQSAEIEAEMQKLLALSGFGIWTVNYIAMRALAWPDAFPHTDYGIKKALPDMKETELLKLADTWRPWRAYAAINLWNSLEHKSFCSINGAVIRPR
jgi:AraC family transcriptional regulator of adaptative response / DNA-3-methyladenine glycosylase II